MEYSFLKFLACGGVQVEKGIQFCQITLALTDFCTYLVNLSLGVDTFLFAVLYCLFNFRYRSFR